MEWSDDDDDYGEHGELLPSNKRDETVQAKMIWSRYQPCPDRLLESLYQYYRGGGFQTLQLTRISNLIILMFMLLAVLWLAYGVPWYDDTSTLRVCKTPWCTGKRVSWWGWCFTGLVVAGWSWQWAQFWWVERPKWREAQLVMRHVLMVRDRQLGNVEFEVILGRMADLLDLPIKVVVERMMRRENYLIGLFNARDEKTKKRLLGVDGVPLSKPLEWALSFALLNFLFDTTTWTIHSRFLSRHPHDREALIRDLSKRSCLFGFLMLISSPLVFILTAAYILFRYGEEFYRDSSTLARRQYSHQARWCLRHPNELPHQLDRRLLSTQKDADLYISQFKDLKMAAICRVVGFMAGTCLILVLLVLVRFRGGEREELWWVGVLGAVVAMCRGQQAKPVEDTCVLRQRIQNYLESEELELSDRQFHTLLSHWYPLKVKVVLMDLLGTITTPLVLIFHLPSVTPQLVDFFRQHTIYKDHVGWCYGPSTVAAEPEQTVENVESSHSHEQIHYAQGQEQIRASTFYKKAPRGI